MYNPLGANVENKKESYLIEIHFCSKKYYAVWETDENGKDSLLQKDGAVFVSHNKNFENVKFATDEITVYEFDSVRGILNPHYGNTGVSPFETLDYKELLSFWNLSQDAANTTGYAFTGNNKRKYADIYEKVFYANNIFKPEGEKDYVPDLTKKDRENLCLIVAQALEMWSEIIGGVTKETAKKQLLRKYNYSNKKLYAGGAKEKSFFIMRGTADTYMQQIRNYLSKKHGYVFYLGNELWSHDAWEKDFFEMSANFDFDISCEEKAIFPKDFSFFICIGHEQDMTFAGDIVEDIQKILDPVKHKFNKYVLC